MIKGITVIQLPSQNFNKICQLLINMKDKTIETRISRLETKISKNKIAPYIFLFPIIRVKMERISKNNVTDINELDKAKALETSLADIIFRLLQECSLQCHHS